MTQHGIVAAILAESTEVMHADEFVQRVYEIETDADHERAKRSLASALMAGAREGLWQGLGGNRYQRKEQSPAETQS